MRKTFKPTHFGELATYYTLEANDLSELYGQEYSIREYGNGIELISKEDNMLSIFIWKGGIKYESARPDLDTVHVFCKNILIRIHLPPNFQPYIPKTTEVLIKLIQKFSSYDLGDVTTAQISEFLKLNNP